MTHPQYRSDTFNIEAGEFITVNRNADFLVCYEATAPFFIAFDDAPRTNFEKGLSYNAQTDFSRVRIENPNLTSIGVTLGMGRGGIRDARFVVSGSVDTRTDAPPVADTIDLFTIGAGLSVQVAAQDARRKEAIIQSHADTGDVWLRSDTATTAGGVLLRAGSTAVMGTAAAIHAYNPTGADIDLSGLVIREAA